MQNDISAFIFYLHNIKKTSGNTELSYKRDLCKFVNFMEERGITAVTRISPEDLHAYIRYLNERKFAPSTVSRNIASIKALYQYLSREGRIKDNIAEALKAPKIEKKTPEILSMEEVVRLLEQPSGNSDKEIRDKAMLELLYATGIRVTELITLLVQDVNLQMGVILCRDLHKERLVPFGEAAKAALIRYMEEARSSMLSSSREEIGRAHV